VDALQTEESPYRSFSYSMYGMQRLLIGETLLPQGVGGSGIPTFDQYDRLGQVVHEMTGSQSDSMFADTYSELLGDAISSSNMLSAAMAAVNLQGDYSGGTGLQQAARIMSLDPSLRQSERDVFMVGVHSFDQHGALDSRGMNGLLGKIDRDLAALHIDLDARNLWDSTTIVSISDFGRTLTSNGIGTDHAWWDLAHALCLPACLLACMHA